MMRLSKEALVSRDRIDGRIVALAHSIDKDYADRDLVVLCVLKGAAPFTMALMQRLRVPVTLDFVRAKSYEGTESTGTVTLHYTPDTPLAGREVLLVEDILDTGRTAIALLEWTRAQGPASVRVCTLLDKPTRRVVDITADYTGFQIDDAFVVGFGLDYEEQYRNLKDIRTLEAEQ